MKESKDPANPAVEKTATSEKTANSGSMDVTSVADTQTNPALSSSDPPSTPIQFPLKKKIGMLWFFNKFIGKTIIKSLISF